MKHRMITTLVFLFAFAMLGGALPGAAQGGDEINPDLHISWPPPVYTLAGDVPVYGAANVPEMTGFFLECRPLDATLQARESAFWYPVTPLHSDPRQRETIGTWDTTAVPDGLYELRLTVTLANGARRFAVVGPLRVENTPLPFVFDSDGPAASDDADFWGEGDTADDAADDADAGFWGDDDAADTDANTDTGDDDDAGFWGE
ncbi:MAG: hypothetical protein GYB65_09145 [Chloroflexi bacterium]|nr:hypothetical protein [Chloroflexota bacterium]